VWQALAATFNTPAWTITRYELAHTAVPRPKTPGWREYEDLLRLAFRDIQGGAEVAPRMSRAAKDIDRELTKYRS
jgi:multiple sugar transport system substrate-binding protein